MFAEHELYHTTHHLGAAKPRPKRGEKQLTPAQEEANISISGGVVHHPTNDAEVKQTFKLWLERRGPSAPLIKDLKKELKL